LWNKFNKPQEDGKAINKPQEDGKTITTIFTFVQTPHPPFFGKGMGAQ
jgi:hypothetical protein